AVARIDKEAAVVRSVVGADHPDPARRAVPVGAGTHPGGDPLADGLAAEDAVDGCRRPGADALPTRTGDRGTAAPGRGPAVAQGGQRTAPTPGPQPAAHRRQIHPRGPVLRR